MLLHGVVSSSLSFLQSLDSEAAQVLKEIAMNMPDTEFALTAAPDVFQKYEVKGTSVVLFKKVWIFTGKLTSGLESVSFAAI